MSDDQKINWGGLIKGILAGAAIVTGIEMVVPGTLGGIIGAFGGGTPGATSSIFTPEMLGSIGLVIQKIAGAALTIIGASYLFSDGGSQNENAQRHSEQYAEAKESFAVREDMRKMQAVMMARMKAAGHEPAMAMGAQPQV